MATTHAEVRHPRLMSVLELACLFATWSAAARRRSATRWWLDAALILAAGPLVGHDHVPRAQC